MYGSDLDMLVVREVQKDRLRESAHYRMVHAASQSQEHRHTIVCRFGVWIGRHLVRWGSALQRHGAVEAHLNFRASE